LDKGKAAATGLAFASLSAARDIFKSAGCPSHSEGVFYSFLRDSDFALPFGRNGW
jgi:hypothetical protein